MKAPPKQPCCVLWCLIVKQNSDNERQVEQISRATTWGSSESQFAGFIAVGANRGGGEGASLDHGLSFPGYH